MRGNSMNKTIFAVNLAVPLFVILIISAIAGCLGVKKKESIKGELFEYFVRVWEADKKETEPDNKDIFFKKVFDLFVQSYEYEKQKEEVNKLKYYFYKLLMLFVILCIPFLVLVLINGKEWILKDNEWNNIYLYTVILVPLIFAYLVNKYIQIRHYHEIWYRHMRNRHQMEWRMMQFIKDYELQKAGLVPEESITSSETLKINFINDLCEYWKSASEISVEDSSKEDSIFQDISSLFGKE